MPHFAYTAGFCQINSEKGSIAACINRPNSLEFAPFAQTLELETQWRCMMYAVIKTGGKQYRVKQGDTIKVEKLEADQGTDIKITDVLLVASGEDIKIGSPLVAGASVSATVKSHGRGPKIRIIKMKRRKHYRKRMGHRQGYTELSITGIQA